MQTSNNSSHDTVLLLSGQSSESTILKWRSRGRTSSRG